MIGGTGDDIYVVDVAGDVVTENASEGTETMRSSIAYALAANCENLTLTGSAAVNATGNAANNVIAGNSANNLIDGGAGADTMSGGGGDDTFIVDNAGDIVSENVSEGVDTVQSSVTFALGSNVENLTHTSKVRTTWPRPLPEREAPINSWCSGPSKQRISPPSFRNKAPIGAKRLAALAFLNTSLAS
jgi:Ca2+-binding RTX toxin-like protein